MKITDAIKEEHKAVEQLFTEYGEDPRHDLAMKICDELDSHARREEGVAYPAFRTVVPDLINHSVTEHEEARQLIRDVRNASDSESEKDLMTQLKDAILHHVEEEETKVLPAADEEIEANELENLGEQFQENK